MNPSLYSRILKNTITSTIGLMIVVLAIGGILLGRISTFDCILLLCLGIVFFWAKNTLVTDLLDLIKSIFTSGSNAS